MEWLWAVLLALAVSHRPTRPLALLLALKWAANYTAFRLIGETAPALIDVALGTVGVVWASSQHARWADLLTAGFVLTPLAHAWYWLQYGAGSVSGLAYYWIVVGLFTMQVLAVAWPATRRYVRRLFRQRGPIGAGPAGQG